jgi:hypothetical protein
MTTKIIRADKVKLHSSEEIAEFILDVMRNGNEKLGVNDAFSFLDWLDGYLNDIVYGS